MGGNMFLSESKVRIIILIKSKMPAHRSRNFFTSDNCNHDLISCEICGNFQWPKAITSGSIEQRSVATELVCKHISEFLKCCKISWISLKAWNLIKFMYNYLTQSFNWPLIAGWYSTARNLVM